MKILSLVLILALIISAAFANDQDPDRVVRAEDASITQDITLTIPLRAALHVTDTEWHLDLGNDDHIAEYCRFVSKNVARHYGAWQIISWAAGGQLPSAAGFGYPAIRPNDDDITDDDKGYLACVLGKRVQKFSNTPYPAKWTFVVNFAGAASGGFGVFGISGFLQTVTAIKADGSALINLHDFGPTGGWLDSHFIEGFYFDGSEEARTYNLDVIFSMTNL